MELYQVLTLFIFAALFGYIGKTLTQEEKTIYKKIKYFPLIKIILTLVSLIMFFIERNISFIILSILIMIIFWDYETNEKRRNKK